MRDSVPAGTGTLPVRNVGPGCRAALGGFRTPG